MGSSLGIQGQVGCLYSLNCDCLHFGQYFIKEGTAILPSQSLSDVFVDCFVADLISLFEFAVVLAVLLDCIVCEVHKGVATPSEAKTGGSSPNVALLEPVGLEGGIGAGDEQVVSNVKLPALVQERVVDVLLQDESSQTPISISLPTLHPQPDVLQVVVDADPVSLVAALSRLHDPNIAALLDLLLPVFERVIDPLEMGPLAVLSPPANVEGERKHVEDIFFFLSVEIHHQIEEGLLVAEVSIFDEVIVHPQQL